MKKAGLLEIKNRGIWNITDRGKAELQLGIDKLDTKYLTKFEEFKVFQQPRDKKKEQTNENDALIHSKKTPKELLEFSFTKIKEDLVQELLNKTKELEPSSFEKLVIDLLLRMGYGGSRHDAGKAIGQTGDGGIDGIINKDKLGLDSIYIQAKRWDNTAVGRPEIQKFVGALAGRQGNKGVFITTSSFSQEAIKYANSVQNMKVILIDGGELARHMIDFDIGTSVEESYQLKRIDSDYFSED